VTPRVPDAGQISAIFRGGKDQPRIATQLPRAVIVVRVANWEDGESVVRPGRPGRIGPDDVNRLIDGRAHGACIEVTSAAAIRRVKAVLGIGAAWRAKQAADF